MMILVIKIIVVVCISGFVLGLLNDNVLMKSRKWRDFINGK